MSSDERTAPGIVKRCPCCARAYTGAEWVELPWIGELVSEEEDGTRYRASLRNCACGSTIATEEQVP